MIVKNFGYLIALDQEGHFGRAAKSCNVSASRPLLERSISHGAALFRSRNALSGAFTTLRHYPSCILARSILYILPASMLGSESRYRNGDSQPAVRF